MVTNHHVTNIGYCDYLPNFIWFFDRTELIAALWPQCFDQFPRYVVTKSATYCKTFKIHVMVWLRLFCSLIERSRRGAASCRWAAAPSRAGSRPECACAASSTRCWATTPSPRAATTSTSSEARRSALIWACFFWDRTGLLGRIPTYYWPSQLSRMAQNPRHLAR